MGRENVQKGDQGDSTLGGKVIPWHGWDQGDSGEGSKRMGEGIARISRTFSRFQAIILAFNTDF